jgi:hypothetical protein
VTQVTIETVLVDAELLVAAQVFIPVADRNLPTRISRCASGKAGSRQRAARQSLQR